jgi:hypothetical protein
MNITLLVNGVDHTSSVEISSLQIKDVLNQKIDNLQFAVNRYPGAGFEPLVGDGVEVYDDTDLIYKGIILTVGKSHDGHFVIRHEVDCVDSTHYLSRILVVESYEDTTIGDIISDMIARYAPSFTTVNVDAQILVESITFNRMSVSEALEKLSRLSNYSWYVDYDDDIHFFEKNTEPAPFNLTDSSANYIYDSLEVSEDLSQLRNSVVIQGGEAEGDLRTETFSGDGNVTSFSLTNKFAHEPTVTVDGVTQSVGVDYLNDAADYDALWNFNGQYIKFTNPPTAGTGNVVVAGVPLYPILIQREDPASILEYGKSEFAIVDSSITTRQEAFSRGIAELEAYGNKISEGSFSTYTPGLRSGQLINITSAQRGVSEDFLIQTVSFQLLTRDRGYYQVRLATLRSVTLVDFLIRQLKQSGTILTDSDATLLHKLIPEHETLGLGESFTPQSLNYAVTFRLTPQPVAGTSRPFIIEGSPMA